MGDNIHLGDRDGVRTPMQWSVDRNGGFSRADPASLVLPPIMDPIYGFQAVNVEAQASDRHSLLNWTRRMLAVRRQFRAFGRGSLRFLYPGNRKVLAFLREDVGNEGTGETLLCVCNLSRAAQAVELDLSAFEGRVPVDVVGGSTFPPVGRLTYLLTLPPYGFFWFLLAAEAQMPAWHTPAPAAMPEYVTLVLRHDMQDLLDQSSRKTLETETLPAYLPKRRWFADKGVPLHKVRIAYAVPLPIPRGTAREVAVMMSEIEVVVGGRTERYVLPLGGCPEEDSNTPLVQQLALARLRRGRQMGMLTDGFALDGMTFGIMAGLTASKSLPLPDGGELRFLPTSRLADLIVPENPEIRRLSAEQSNSSLVLGDAAVLKIIRRVSEGIHPEVEMTRYLTERGFGNIAPLLGEVTRFDTDGSQATIALVQGFVRNQGDGWGWTLDYLARTIEDLAFTGGADGQDDTSDFATYDVFAAAMGRRLGELHATLAEPADDVDFAPEPVDDAGARAWADGAIEQFDDAMRILQDATDLPPDVKPLANSLLLRADSIRDSIRRLALHGVGTLRTRVHGDFHLGQVLVVQNDAYIIDFEGEPARPMAQRRSKSSPLRDVAGLLRSFEYAAAAAAPGRVASSAQTAERRGELLERFRIAAASSFMDAYRAVLETAPIPWAPRDAGAAGTLALIDLFLLEKAAYEIRYEAANRPTWLGIPVRGLSEIAARVLQED
jgi:maltose alpha-D-glucosyltransferase/alpha-amylase